MADKGSPQKRVSRACTFCRARKSRCDLYVLPIRLAVIVDQVGSNTIGCKCVGGFCARPHGLCFHRRTITDMLILTDSAAGKPPEALHHADAARKMGESSPACWGRAIAEAVASAKRTIQTTLLIWQIWGISARDRLRIFNPHLPTRPQSNIRALPTRLQTAIRPLRLEREIRSTTKMLLPQTAPMAPPSLEILQMHGSCSKM